ncbi:MAG: MFS transporter [Polaromonas sp.]|uniref:MFS transporter n=1 Tax=Polaromonas sp. TaxID=1869339 RepID=UPI00272F90D8|nr:MFS transporter [Polaromonas sp.]MDP1740769.1 MFS transporter [Polaromonas sp.]MDP1954522.1 MFS transporter [Polaromonas sp.]MDP3356983.1 MFS transporter [Polaromonas sp.]MDP3753508.1 MFS transporter [Polaromonas sp.]
MSTSLSPKRELWLLVTLAGIQFTHIVDFMVMMPLGPQFTQLFNISDASFGLLVSAYTFAAGASGLLASLYVDRFGRKNLLLVLYLLFALATLACGLAPNYDSLMLARIAAGTFGGVMSALSQTIIADVIPFERRGRAMGIVMSSFSLASVAGVPLSLFLAAHFGWHAPFFAIAGVSAVLALGAWVTLPPLTGHLQQKRRSPLGGIVQVLRDNNHLKAFLFSALLMFSGFTVIPYITIFITVNGGFTVQQVPYLYLCGGAATLVTARYIGRLSDSVGKVRVFSYMAMAAAVPMLVLSQSAGFGVWGILLVTTALFIGMNGRMVPGMALVASAANPQLRGTFMALNSSVQSAAMGAAAFVGGLIISRDAQGLVQNYGGNALLGVLATALSLMLVRKLHLHGAPTINPR